MQLWGLLLKSELTSGSSQYSRMPFKGPSAAALKAVFTSSTVTFLDSVATKSVTETVAVGDAEGHAMQLPIELGNH